VADQASVPERARETVLRSPTGHPEPDEKLAAVPDLPCLYDVGMYVALSGWLSYKIPFFGENT